MSKRKKTNNIAQRPVAKINKGTFKQRKIMQASWVVATWFLSEVVATHNWYDQMKSDKFAGMQVFLSSMLMMQDSEKLHYSRNKNSHYMMESFLDKLSCKEGETKKVMVVQVMNDFEFNVAMPGTHQANVANVNHYIGKSRQVRQNQKNFVLYKSEFTIPDFTHGPDPVKQVHDDFQRFLAKYEEVQPDIVDIHCKAGKNRSFKIMTAFTAYKELKEEKLSAAIIVKQVHGISQRIAGIRQCVSFQKKNQATHIAFAAQLVAEKLQPDVSVADIKRQVAVSLLQEYQSMRRQEQEHYSQFFEARCANPFKLPAVEKLVAELRGLNTAGAEYSVDEIHALLSGRLGTLVGHLRNLNSENFDIYNDTQFSQDLQAYQNSQSIPYDATLYLDPSFSYTILG